MTTRAVFHALLAAGLLLLAAELYRDPHTALSTIAIFGGIWVVRRRLVHRRHHHSSRLYRLRREIVTVAVFTVMLVTIASVLFAALDVSADVLSTAPPVGAAADSQTPWAATFLLDGFLTTVAAAWIAMGALAAFRRTSRNPSPPPLVG